MIQIQNKYKHKHKKNFPLNGLKVPLYLTGKADCAGDGDTNKWMDPVKIPDDVIIIIISSYHHHHIIIIISSSTSS